MRGFLFASANNSKGKHDGDEFVREMYKCANYHEFHESNIKSFECYEKRYPARRREFVEQLEFNDLIILFCHGSRKWIFGAGYNLWNISKFAWQIKKNINPKSLDLTVVNIILYTCSCGKGKGTEYPVGQVPNKAGVAMMLANELAELGVNFYITAHTTKGHTTRNKNCVTIWEDDQGNICKTVIVPRVTGRQRLKNPIGRKRWLNWCKMLDTDPTFRFEFPFLSIVQIHKILDEYND